ncbi:MAG: hypothetical protein P4L53_07540 [Candidatus Obscuribacterales bacterium]|nr:hypothetical protein [Candidatus Obscuribacterales bacterium]
MSAFGTDKTISKPEVSAEPTNYHLLHEFQEGAKHTGTAIKKSFANIENEISDHPKTALATLAVGAAALYLTKGEALGKITQALSKGEAIDGKALELPSMFQKSGEEGSRKLFTESLKPSALREHTDFPGASLERSIAAEPLKIDVGRFLNGLTTDAPLKIDVSKFLNGLTEDPPLKVDVGKFLNGLTEDPPMKVDVGKFLHGLTEDSPMKVDVDNFLHRLTADAP